MDVRLVTLGWVAACGTSPVAVTPLAITGDGQNVYIADDAGGHTRIFRQADSGGPLKQLASAGESASWLTTPMVSDGEHVYFAVNDASTKQGDIQRVPVAGGATSSVATGSFVISLAVDATTLYWCTQDIDGVDGGAVYAMPLDAGTPVAIASFATEQPYSLVVLANELVFATTNQQGDGHLYRLAKAGGAPTAIDIGTGYAPGSVAADDQFVYWIDIGYVGPYTTARTFGAPTIARAPLAGGMPEAVFDHLVDPRSLVLDGTNLYFLDTNMVGVELITEHGAIERLPITGGTPVVLANAEWPVSLAVDATSVIYLYGPRGDNTARTAK